MAWGELSKYASRHGIHCVTLLRFEVPLLFLLRRLGFYLVAAWASLTLNFAIPRLMPGDPAQALIARSQGQLDPQAIAALQRVLGLTDAPLWRQYCDYVWSVLHAELGVSVTQFPSTVSQALGNSLLWTLYLAGTSTLIAFALGSVLGIWCAWRRASWLDRWLLPGLIFVSAFPYFWLAMALLYALGLQLQWFPVRHAYDDGLRPELSLDFLLSVLEHAALPATAIVLASLGGWMLSMRNSMLAVLSEDYVTLARAKGLDERRVMLQYAARNAILPNLTGLGMALGFVLGGSLLTEIVFSYPGQGYLLVQAVRGNDYPLMQGLFLSITLAVLLGNGLVDAVHHLLDPRARSR